MMGQNEVNFTQRLGFIGLGAIGAKIAINLCKSGYLLNIYNRSKFIEENDLLKECMRFSTPLELAKNSNVIMICVSDDIAVEEVLFGENGVFSSIKSNSIIIDLSTISPSKARSNYIRLLSKGVNYLDCPVTGGTEGAEKGLLSIFVGGNEESLNAVKPILKKISSSICYFGESGKGQEVKAINQVLVAGTYIAVAEAISLGKRLKLPLPKVINALSNGAASSWALLNRSESMISDEYPLGFKLSLHYKDLLIALELSENVGLSLPISSQVKEIEEKLINNGLGSLDVSALHIAINK